MTTSALTVDRGVAPTQDEWTTPRIFRAIQMALIGLTVLFLLLAEASLDRARHATKTIWKDTAPSILTALELQTLLADLDADAANVIVDPGNKSQILQVFEDERTLLSRRLIEAAQNITYGDSEKVPIMAISDQLGRYLELTGRAMLLHERGDVQGATIAYRAATDVMHDKLLPAARALDVANASVMTSVYAEQVRSTRVREAMSLLVGGVLVLSLLAAQVFLTRRTRRLINVPLLVATLSTAALFVYLGTMFSQSSANLKLAREDAFQSIQALWALRAIAHDANGDESRFLLDRDRASQSERSFFDKMYVLHSAPETTTIPSRTSKTGPAFRGKLADIVSNITFTGEREAVQRVLDELARYWKVDARIRAAEALNTQEQHRNAVALCLGESNDAFLRFDRAIDVTVKINQVEFDRALSVTDTNLKRAEIIDPFLAGLTALLVFVGIRQRLREYD